MRIYAACLASYNAGILHGAWIDATSDVEEMQEAVDAMLRASPCPNVMVKDPTSGKMVPSAEEWAIHDHEGLGPDLGEFAGLAEVARRAAICEVAEDRDIPAAVLIEAMRDAGADDAEDYVSDYFDGTAETWKAFAERFMDDFYSEEMDKLPSIISGNIDYDGIAKDLELSGDWSAYREDEFGDLYFFRSN